MTGPARVVIVGAGLAGLRTAEELRAKGYTGALTLIGAEARPPYDRPPLSKKVLTGEIDDTGLHPDLDSLGIDLRLAETAVQLGDGVLRTTAADYPWDALVLATGANPVTLPGDGEQRVLRTVDDALALRERLTPGTRLAVVGAGWIGAELATAAARRGCEVTVVEAGQAPLAAAVGAEIGSQTAPWYAEAGVDLQLRTAVAAIEPGGIALADGRWLPADLVVTAVGVRPAGWITGSSWMPGWLPRCRACMRWETALRSGPAGTSGSCVLSTGILRCTRRRWRPRTSRAAGSDTTPFRTSGLNSSAGWCSMSAGTAPPTRSCGAAGRPPRSGRLAGWQPAGWSPL